MLLWSMLHHWSVERVRNKDCFFWFLFFLIIKIVFFSFSFRLSMRHQISAAEYKPIRNRNWWSKIVAGTVCVGQKSNRGHDYMIMSTRPCQIPKTVWAISPRKYQNLSNSQGNISNSKFFSGWLKLPIYTGEVKNLNFFHRGLVL